MKRIEKLKNAETVRESNKIKNKKEETWNKSKTKSLYKWIKNIGFLSCFIT